jgi:hypothetical protein
LNGSVATEKNKIQNKQSSVTSIKWLCARCVNCGRWRVIQMFLEEASLASYQMLPKKSNLCYQKKIGKNQDWMKNSERKTMSESEVNERETFTHW